MSGRSLMDPGKTQERADELESFFHVYTYYILRYQDCRLSDHDLAQAMTAIYDQRSDSLDLATGGQGKKMFFLGDHIAPFLLGKLFCRPLARLIENLRQIFRPLYTLSEFTQDELDGIEEDVLEGMLLEETAEKARLTQSMKSLQTSTRFISEFDKAINKTDWVSKPAVDRLAPLEVSKPTAKRHMESFHASSVDYKRRRELGPLHESDRGSRLENSMKRSIFV